jgi:hypothetical protein
MADDIRVRVRRWSNETVAEILGDRPANDHWRGCHELKLRRIPWIAASILSYAGGIQLNINILDTIGNNARDCAVSSYM